MLALDPPFCIYRKLKGSQAEKYPDSRDDSRGNRLHDKTLRIQTFSDLKFPFKFRIQNLRRHEQTGEFSFQIPPLVCKRQNQSGTKTFRIRHESGKASSSVNVVFNNMNKIGVQRMLCWNGNHDSSNFRVKEEWLT